MLDEEFVPTKTLQHWKHDWLSTIRTSRAERLEGALIILPREAESKPVEIDRMPEA